MGFMSNAEIHEQPPIYRGLVKERGDVLVEAREVAEQTERQARQALDWSDVRFSRHQREESSFSPFR
ncbi:hypothetical protein GPZ77_01420 [Streptomyces sp. QHH-9511]|nr:hypothetical protein GPZ77_01420 [Streptomyces sp. QHH-9511]